MERQAIVAGRITFLTAWLKEVDKASVRKKMAEIGLKVADQLGDKKALVRYAEAQVGH